MAEQAQNRPSSSARPSDGTFALRAIDSADRMTRSLSPWVREMLDGANTPTDRGSLVGRLMRRRADESVSFLSTLAILRRFHRIVTRTTSWKAGVGTVSPNLFEKFSEEMFKNWDMGANNISALLKINRQEEALEMPLAGEVGGSTPTPAGPPANPAPAMTMEEIRRRVAEARQFESMSPTSVPNFVKSQDADKPDVRPVAQHPSNRPARPAPPRPTDQPIARQLPGQTPPAPSTPAPTPPTPPSTQQPQRPPGAPAPRMMRRRMARQVEYLSMPDTSGEDGGESEGSDDSEASPAPQFDTGPPGLDWFFPENETDGPDWFAPASAEARLQPTAPPTQTVTRVSSRPVLSSQTVVQPARRPVRVQSVRGVARKRPAPATSPATNPTRSRRSLSRPSISRPAAKPDVPSIVQRAVGRLALSASGQLLASRPQILLDHIQRAATAPAATSPDERAGLLPSAAPQDQPGPRTYLSAPALSSLDEPLAALDGLAAADRPVRASPLQRQSSGDLRLAPVSLADFALAAPLTYWWRADPLPPEAPVAPSDQPEPPARASGIPRRGRAVVKPAVEGKQPAVLSPAGEQTADAQPAVVRPAARTVVQRLSTGISFSSVRPRVRRRTGASQSAARPPLEQPPALALLQSLPLRPSPTVMRLAAIPPFDRPSATQAESQTRQPVGFQPEPTTLQGEGVRPEQFLALPRAEQPTARRSAVRQSVARADSVLQRLLLRPLPTVMRLAAADPFAVPAPNQAESQSVEPDSSRPVDVDRSADIAQERAVLPGPGVDPFLLSTELRHEFEPVSGVWRSTLLRSRPVASGLLPAEPGDPLSRSAGPLPDAAALLGSDRPPLSQADEPAPGQLAPAFLPALELALARFRRATTTATPSGDLGQPTGETTNETAGRARPASAIQRLPQSRARRVDRGETARPGPTLLERVTGRDFAGTRTDMLGRGPLSLSEPPGAASRWLELAPAQRLQTERPQAERLQALSSGDVSSIAPSGSPSLQRQSIQPPSLSRRPVQLRYTTRPVDHPVASSARTHTRLLLQRAAATTGWPSEQPATLQNRPRGLRLPIQRAESPLPPLGSQWVPDSTPAASGREAGISPRQTRTLFAGVRTAASASNPPAIRLGESGVVAQRLAAARTRLEPVSRLWRSAHLTGAARPSQSVAFGAAPALLADLSETGILTRPELSTPESIARSATQPGVDTPLPLAPASRGVARSPAQPADIPAQPSVLSSAPSGAGEVLVDRMSVGRSPQVRQPRSPVPGVERQALASSLPHSLSRSAPTLLERVARRVYPPTGEDRRGVEGGKVRSVTPAASAVEKQSFAAGATGRPSVAAPPAPRLLQRSHQPGETAQAALQMSRQLRRMVSVQPASSAWVAEPARRTTAVPVSDRLDSLGQLFASAPSSEPSASLVDSSTSAGLIQRGELPLGLPVVPARLNSLRQTIPPAATEAALDPGIEPAPVRRRAADRAGLPQQTTLPARADARQDLRIAARPAPQPAQGAKLTATLLDLTRQPTGAVGLPRQRNLGEGRGNGPTPVWPVDDSGPLPQLLPVAAPVTAPSAPVRPLSETVLRRDFGDTRRQLLQRSAPGEAPHFASGDASAQGAAPTPKTLFSPGALGRSASNLTVRQQARHRVQPVSDLWRSELLQDAELPSEGVTAEGTSTAHSGRDLAGSAAITGDELLRPGGLLPSPGDRTEPRESPQPSVPASFAPLELALNRLLRPSARTGTGEPSVLPQAPLSAPMSAGGAADTPILSQRTGATAPSQRRAAAVSGTVSTPVPQQSALVTGAGRVGPSQSAAVAVQRLEAGGWRFKRSRPGPAAAAAPAEGVQRALTGLATGSRRPIPERSRTLLERVLQRDFAGVRVQMASLGPLGIEAAAQGNTVYLDRAQADLNRSDSLALLGHELTHVAAGGAAPLPAGDRVQRSPAADDLPLAHGLAPSLTRRLSRQLVQMSLAEEERVAEQVEAVVRSGGGAEAARVVSTSDPSVQGFPAQRPSTQRISTPGTAASGNGFAPRRPVQRTASIAAGSRSVAALAQRRLATSRFAPVSQSWPAQDFAQAGEPVALLDAPGWLFTPSQQTSASPSETRQPGPPAGGLGDGLPLSHPRFANSHFASTSGPASASATVDLLEDRGWRFKRREGTSTSPAKGVSQGAGAIQRAAAELHRGPSGGMPLPRRPRTLMERVLQRDFSGVRLQAAGLEPLGVEAATHGQTVYMQRSALAQLDRPDNLALLGHELTHVAVGTNPTVRRLEQVDQSRNGMEGAGPMPLSLPAVNQLRGSVQREEQAAGQVEQGIQALLRQGSVQREPLAPRPRNGPGSSPGPVKPTRAGGNGSQGRIDTRVGSGGGFAPSVSGDLPVVRRRAVLGQPLASLPASGGGEARQTGAEGPVLDGVSTESMPVVQRFLDRPNLPQNGLAEGTPGASDLATTHYPLQRSLPERIQRSPEVGGGSDVDDEMDEEMNGDMDDNQEPDWDGLAERIYPLIRRMIEMERERRPL